MRRLCHIIYLFCASPPPHLTLFPLHDALPFYDRLEIRTCRVGAFLEISKVDVRHVARIRRAQAHGASPVVRVRLQHGPRHVAERSEEHTSELQSLTNLVCRLLLEKKNTEHSSP